MARAMLKDFAQRRFRGQKCSYRVNMIVVLGTITCEIYWLVWSFESPHLPYSTNQIICSMLSPGFEQVKSGDKLFNSDPTESRVLKLITHIIRIRQWAAAIGHRRPEIHQLN